MDERKDRNVTVFLIRVFFSLRNAIFNISGIWEPNPRDVSPSNEEKCFVEVIHTAMHGEHIVAKKSKPSVNVESIASVKEEMIEPVREETTVSGKENEGFDTVRILMVVGGLFCVLFLVFFILRYVMHMI
jgi:hypothetical protein